MSSGSIVHGPSSGEKFIGNVWWTAGNNIAFREYKKLTDWAAATGQEKLNGQMMGKQVDPQLMGPFLTTVTDPYQLHSLSGYSLLPQSSLRNSGLNLQDLFKIKITPHDFFGNKVPQGSNPEPGVHEMDE